MKILCYIYLMISLTTKNPQHILIGDSQTYLLKKHSSFVIQKSKLCQAGIGIQQLISKVKRFPIQSNIKSVTICIGVNDGYVDKGINQLIFRINKTFPNAKVYVIKGSWGWGKVRRLNMDKINNYYKKFEDLGACILETPIGHGDPHKNKKIYKTIMSELEWKITQEQQE